MNDNDQVNGIKTIQLTQEGYEELKAELDELVTVKLPQAVDRVAQAREYGDLSENSEYHNARNDKDLIEARIDEIERVLERAKIVKVTKSIKEVGMGSQVAIYVKGHKDQKKTIQIVGEFEADPSEGKISSVSPLGKALMGKKKAEEAKVSAPARDVVYVIAEIK